MKLHQWNFRNSKWVVLLPLLVSLSASGAPQASDYDVFIEAEAIQATNRFLPMGPPQLVCSSGDRGIGLWSPTPPGAEGYFARYEFTLDKSGTFWLLVWAQGLDTKLSSPFWVTIDRRRFHFTSRDAKIPKDQYRYGNGGITLHAMGPITLKKGTHSLTLKVNERRAFKAPGEEKAAYNLIVDAMALTSVNPLRSVIKAPVKLAVDVEKKQGPFVPIVDLSQGGIGGVASPEFWAPIAPMLKKIGVHQIRIDHIWDYYGIVSQGTDGKFIYDWTRFDAVLDQFEAAGASPFLCVSYLPPPLSSDGQAYGVPNDMEKWKTICAELARHMTQRKNGAGLYYEIWNEPDGFGTKVKEDYYKIYRYAAEGILSADPTAKIGGPATALNDWIEGFVKYVRDNKLRLDFVSWHWYNAFFDVNSYASQIDDARAILRREGFGDDLEVMFTEWNLNGNVVPYNDAFYNAGNAAATLGVFHEKKLKHSHFFFPKDPVGEKELTGWYGAITHTNKPKPVYNLFDAYSRLQGDMAAVNTSDSRIGAFATVKENTSRVLIWHFDGTTPFGLTRDIHFSINLPAGNYTVSKYLIDNKHSNLAETPESPGLSQVEQKSVNVEGDSGWKENISLQNGGVMLIEYQKK